MCAINEKENILVKCMIFSHPHTCRLWQISHFTGKIGLSHWKRSWVSLWQNVNHKYSASKYSLPVSLGIWVSSRNSFSWPHLQGPQIRGWLDTFHWFRTILKARIKWALLRWDENVESWWFGGVWCLWCRSYRSFKFKTIHQNSLITLADAISNVKH